MRFKEKLPEPDRELTTQAYTYRKTEHSPESHQNNRVGYNALRQRMGQREREELGHLPPPGQLQND